MPSLCINLLGDFRLYHDSTLVTNFVQLRLQALLAYLLLHRNSPQSRQQLAFLFWPNTARNPRHAPTCVSSYTICVGLCLLPTIFCRSKREHYSGGRTLHISSTLPALKAISLKRRPRQRRGMLLRNEWRWNLLSNTTAGFFCRHAMMIGCCQYRNASASPILGRWSA